MRRAAFYQGTCRLITQLMVDDLIYVMYLLVRLLRSE